MPDEASEHDLLWPGLLAQWTRFAQASVALPKTPDGDRWRAAVPAVIALQAVALALDDLERLPTPERPLAIDRAEVLIRRHESELRALFGALKGELAALVADAWAASAAARARGLGSAFEGHQGVKRPAPPTDSRGAGSLPPTIPPL